MLNGPKSHQVALSGDYELHPPTYLTLFIPVTYPSPHLISTAPDIDFRENLPYHSAIIYALPEEASCYASISCICERIFDKG